MRVLSIPTTFGLNKPISGGQNRFYNITVQLVKHCNEVTVLEEVQFSDGTNTTVANVGTYRDVGHTVYSPGSKEMLNENDCRFAEVATYRDLKFLGMNLSIFRDLNLRFHIAIARLLNSNKIDLIQVSHPSGILSVKLILCILRKRIPVVYDAHNLESEYVRESYAVDLKYPKLVKTIVVTYVDILERLVCKYIADFVTTASSRDRQMMLTKYSLPTDKVEVISSGCDVSPFADDSVRTTARTKLGIPMDVTAVVFHGFYSHPPNKEAFDMIRSYIAPRFRELNDKVKFVVGGTGAPQFTEDNLISVGSIDDMREFLSIADIAIVPLRHGAGIKLKVLDYLSAGLPMVVTVKGTQGIDVTDGHDSIVLDDCDEHFVRAILRLVENAEERSRIGANARRLAEEKYNWIEIGNRLNALYQRIVG